MASLARPSRVLRPTERSSRPASASFLQCSRNSPPQTAVLDAFMGYVATFFHAEPQRPPPPPPSRRPSPSQSYQHAARYPNALHARGAKRRPAANGGGRRGFHDYFVTHLPSSSIHPDRSAVGPHHKLPRAASMPHTPGPGSSPAAAPPNMPSRDLTVVRIPLRSAKHHFGVSVSRGSRVYNEDTHQAGTIDMPAFARRAPVSLVRGGGGHGTGGGQVSRLPSSSGEGIAADSSFGDPQIFYFAVFDGHGGTECSDFLRDELAGYIEDSAARLGLQSSLAKHRGNYLHNHNHYQQQQQLGGRDPASLQEGNNMTKSAGLVETESGTNGVVAEDSARNAMQLEIELVEEYRNTVGGYFRRFNPAYFNLPPLPHHSSRSHGHGAATSTTTTVSDANTNSVAPNPTPATVEAVLAYAFLRADLDFITAQARKPDPDDPHVADSPLNCDEILGRPHLPPSGHGIGGGRARFKGGSTASIALISTPTPAPYWHPAAHSTLVVAHVGDTRILLCETATGLAVPLTSDHRPSSPAESRRLRRYATDSLVTDSFGEERIAGLANSRSFGDMQGKRVGVSAEPDIVRAELGPARYSFLVLLSDGVSGTLSDQEIVDVVKEARTPDEAARHVVEYATEISADGDNATCLVVRLGGWERRSEGGLGSLGTKEIRDIRRAEASDPRRGIR